MEINSSRGPFERSLKNRSIMMGSSNRYSDRESVESGNRGGFMAQNNQIEELVIQYRTALAELTSNSKPIITNLTIIAGENLHAAKAVASTVCANILEVPSDQKLPSLYLLDSIVKNIGEDYIKYFGIRLPEVFCKAYRQVDPSTHRQMRHLFGTWKGVFPLQTLQMIEKELAFPPAVNGSSSGSATSRSEPQPQRPAQSIHVNPKYLEERQRLQQPSKAKGPTYDSSMTLGSSPRDAKGLDRAVGMSSGRQWLEPTLLKTQGTQRQQDAPDEFVREKNIVAAYGSYDHDSDHSSQSGLEIGRVKEKISDKPWYGANNTFDEKIFRRNGLGIKQGVPSYEPPMAEKTNVHLMPRNSISGKSSSGIDESWKNSDEEEYMWDNLNSKSLDQRSIGNSRHLWTPDEPNKSGLENGLWGSQSLEEFGSRMDRETSADALSIERRDQANFRNRRSPSWTEEPYLTADTNYSVSGIDKLGHSDAYTNPLGGASTPANPVTRTHIPSLTSPSQTGNSKFRCLTNPELVPLVAVGQKRQFASDYSAEQDYHQSQLSHRPKMAKSQVSAIQSNRSQSSHDTLRLHPNDMLTNSPELPPQHLRTSSPIAQSVLTRHQLPVAEPSSQYGRSPLPEIKVSANTPSSGKSLLTHSKKNEVLSKKSGTSIKAGTSIKSGTSIKTGTSIKAGTIAKANTSAKLSSSVPNPPVPNVRPPKTVRADPRLAAGSSRNETSQAKLSASTAHSQKKTEEKSLAHGPPPPSQPSDTASDPMSSLLSTLVAKGLITASKAETPTSSIKQISTQLPKLKPTTIDTIPVPVSSIPVASNKKLPSDTNEPPKSAEKLPVEDVKPLIGLEFKPDLIRQSHPFVISELHHDLPHQCDLCGLRLKLQEQFERHLEWHALRKPELNREGKNSRRWYANQENWVAGEDETCSEARTSGDPEETEMMVPADESQCVCVLCGEIFEDVYCLKTDEWMFKGAAYLSVPLEDSMAGTLIGSASKGPIVHSNCISENSLKDLGFPAADIGSKDA